VQRLNSRLKIGTTSVESLLSEPHVLSS
jgi:hypothetical protein